MAIQVHLRRNLGVDAQIAKRVLALVRLGAIEVARPAWTASAIDVGAALGRRHTHWYVGRALDPPRLVRDASALGADTPRLH